jgi:hypothetical protein
MSEALHEHPQNCDHFVCVESEIDQSLTAQHGFGIGA